jgi:riboflavin kinase
MKPYLLKTLKEIAKLGGIKNKIEVSSKEIGKKIKTSQQTASRYILELDKKGFITREFGIKKQIIEISNNGKNFLKEEYLDYKHIFEFSNKIFFKGKIVSGIGEGRYYTEQNGYIEQFKEKLGFIPYPGTLNVEIEYIEKNKLRLLKNHDSIIIQEFKTKNRSFGGVSCLRAKINNVPAVIVLPLRSHYSNILEFISSEFLRKKLGLKDGDIVEIEIFLD